MYYSTSFGPFCTSFFCHRSNWNLPINTLQGISGIVTKFTSACHGAKPVSLCYFIDMITPFGCQIIFVSFFLWIAYSELPAFLVKEGGLNSGKHFVSPLPPMAFCFYIFPSALLWQITETVFLLCLILDGYLFSFSFSAGFMMAHCTAASLGTFNDLHMSVSSSYPFLFVARENYKYFTEGWS